MLTGKLNKHLVPDENNIFYSFTNFVVFEI
jgi:hypothetical protein